MSPGLSKVPTCFEADEGWINSIDKRCVALKSAALEFGSLQEDKNTTQIKLSKMCLR
jgi:hypothetical protein